MNDIGVFTPEQARLLWQDYQTRKQLAPQVSQNYPQRRLIDEVSPHRVFVKNSEEEAIPPYACLRIIGTEVVGGRTALTVEKPTSTDGEFVFNSQYAIAVDGTGWAYRYDIIVMLGDGTAPTAANVPYAPVVGSWEITEEAGPFVVFGQHVDGEDALIGRVGRVSGGDGSKRIKFTIVEVVCVDDYNEELYVLVEWTHYTGGCIDPPGVDYDGYITVYDDCILSYFTAEDLVGRTGSATYWTIRSDCSKRWIVDDICGEPQC